MNKEFEEYKVKAIERLVEQKEKVNQVKPYLVLGWERQRVVWERACYFASLTVHTRWTTAWQYWTKGLHNPLPCANKFYHRHCQSGPYTQEQSAKLNFARALAGVSLADNAVCLDVHLLRRKARKQAVPHNAIEQWLMFFNVMKTRYGVEQATKIIKQHLIVMDWIAGV